MSKVNTPKFRVAYPSVFQPKKNELNGNDEYSLVALFEPGADLTDMKNAALEAAKKKWGEDKAKWPANLRSPFRKCEEKYKMNDKTGQMELPDGFKAGGFFVTLRSTQKPGVVDQDVQDIIDTSDFYGGCYARASVHAYAYEAKGNKGIAFGLGNVQKMSEGEPFGNRTKPADDFAPVQGTVAGAQAAPASDMFA